MNNSLNSWRSDDEHKWICDRCTYCNFPSSIKCTMCRHLKSSINQDIYSLSNDDNGIGAEAKCDSFIDNSSTADVAEAAAAAAVPTSLADAISTENTSVTNHISDSLPPILNTTWVCDSCSFANQESDTQCSRCNRNVAVNAINLHKLMEPLQISSCDLENPQLPTEGCSDVCDSTSTAAEHAQKWCCTICTYENWPRSQKCAMCGHKAQHVQKFTQIAPSISLANHSANTKNFTSQNLNDFEQKIRIQKRKADSKWLNACIGVVDGDRSLVDVYLSSGGDVTRKLSSYDCSLLNRSSAFEVGQTLVHLAIRYNQQDILSALLAEIKGSGSGLKRVPSYVAPDLASDIRRYVATRLSSKKNDFPCYFLSEITTFALPEEIETLPMTVQEQMFSEILDQDAQDQLETESSVINWSTEVTERLGSRLNVLWNRSTGDCLLDSVMQATFGVSDRDNTLRRALADSLLQAGADFYPRWKEYEASQAFLRHFALDDSQFEQDWLNLLTIASQPGSSLEQLHVFVLAHILRRPIIVYGVKYVKSFRGETLDYARFQGVYLPLMWKSSFCSRSPIALGYTRGHFSALVPFQPFSSRFEDHQLLKFDSDVVGEDDDEYPYQIAFLPLMDHNLKLLPFHFLVNNEVGKEELILHEWLDVCQTDSGLLLAQQKIFNQPLLVGQIIEEWLNHYRHLASLICQIICNDCEIRRFGIKCQNKTHFLKEIDQFVNSKYVFFAQLIEKYFRHMTSAPFLRPKLFT